MRIPLRDIARSHVLAGSTNGTAALLAVIETVSPVSRPSPVYLDFDRVEVATGSFLRELVVGFRDYCRRSRPDLCPVVANANEVVLEELRELLKTQHDAMVACTARPDGRVTDARVIGVIDEKQRITLAAIVAAGESDATTLATAFAHSDGIGTTGWNNRLATLAAKGILVEVRHGRTKKYKPVFEGLSYGS